MSIFNKLVEATWYSLFELIDHDKQKNQALYVRMLKIPPYQRVYVWDENKIANLLNGIALSMKEQKQYYFLGSIVLCKEDKNEDYSDYLIVDGQQRLTSLNIIVSVIRQIGFENKYNDLERKCTDFLESIKKEKRRLNSRLDEAMYKLCISNTNTTNYGSEFRFYIQAKNYDKLRKLLLRNDGHTINEYLLRLKKNFNKIYDILFDKDEGYLYDLVRYISNKCKFVVMMIEKFLDAHRIFCTLNIAGEQLSPLDFYRAKFYGKLIKEKGIREANRAINSQLKILSTIHSELGSVEMRNFLAHVYRIKMVEKHKKEDFLTSFNFNDSDLLQFFNMYSDDVHECDEFLKQISNLFEIWKRIFIYSDKCVAKEALKLLRNNHWEIWLTVALASAAYGIQLNEEFWKKLEKFMTIVMVLISNRFATVEIQSHEILTRCFEEIEVVMELQQCNLFLPDDMIQMFVEQIKGDVFTKLNEYCLTYLLLRLNFDVKFEPTKINYKIDRFRIEPVSSLGTLSLPRDDFTAYAGYLGNFILVSSAYHDRFHNKEWKQKKDNAHLLIPYPLSHSILSLDEWNVEEFKKIHCQYMQRIGRFYDLQDLVNFCFEEDYISRKRKLQEPVFFKLPHQTSEPEPKKLKLVNDIDVRKAADNLSLYLRENMIYTVEGIKQQSQAIDPASTGLLNPDITIQLLIRLQKTHKIFARKWQTTLRKWIYEANMGDRGCFYPGIFLNHDPFAR